METESQNFLVKIGVYIIGVTVGLMSKLAVMHNEKPLTFTITVAHTLTAFTCAWAVWFAMDYYHAQDWFKNGISVIVGRYGDYILIALWRTIKGLINSKTKDVI